MTHRFGWAAAAIAATMVFSGCQKSGPTGASAEDFRRGEEAWRAAREAEIKGPESWLTIVGLSWLEEGENVFGTDASNAIVLPAGSAPPWAGKIVKKNEEFILRAEPGVALMVNGRPLTESTIRDEGRGIPDVIGLGRLTFWIIKRDARYGIRLRDPESAPRKAFTGIEYYPPAPEFRITGTFRPLPEPKAIRVEAKIVGTAEMTAVGTVAFRFQDRDYEIEAWKGEIEGTIHFVLGDPTNGEATYGGGRFLDAPLLEGGRVDLNFNRLTNPPCAFSAFATCPLPPKANRLPFRIEAGEKAYAGPGH
jgi:uncharacterized protein